MDRLWQDWQFFIASLFRLRRAAQLARRAPSVADEIAAAIRVFDQAVPGLVTMRNVAEHIDEYAMDEGRAAIARGELWLGIYNYVEYKWLGYRLNADAAMDAAEQLCQAMLIAWNHAMQSRHEGRPGLTINWEHWFGDKA